MYAVNSVMIKFGKSQDEMHVLKIQSYVLYQYMYQYSGLLAILTS